MNRLVLRIALYGLLLAVLGFAVWRWTRPYDGGADPGARFTIVGAQLTRDHSNFWLDLHLEKRGNEDHDFSVPVVLKTRTREMHPDKIDLAGGSETGVTGIWLRFWLETTDVEGPLTLSLNGGSLLVKSTTTPPAIGSSGKAVYQNPRW